MRFIIIMVEADIFNCTMANGEWRFGFVFRLCFDFVIRFIVHIAREQMMRNCLQPLFVFSRAWWSLHK
jgi:hypothetical protein